MLSKVKLEFFHILKRGASFYNTVEVVKGEAEKIADDPSQMDIPPSSLGSIAP